LGAEELAQCSEVLWACAELGLQIEHADMGGKFGYTDDYLVLNPNCSVPPIEDDGFFLWESNAIVRYLSEKYGADTLWPQERPARADADRWMDWTDGRLWAAFMPAFVALTRASPEARNDSEINGSNEKTSKLLEILERHLANRKYVAGATFTMGDIPIGIVVSRWLATGLPRPARPNIEVWQKRLSASPAFKQCVQANSGS
jgi:glutathione S-transferase